MCVERGFISPLGMNVEHMRISSEVIEMDADASGLGSRRLNDSIQLFEKLVVMVWFGLETRKDVERHSFLGYAL